MTRLITLNLTSQTYDTLCSLRLLTSADSTDVVVRDALAAYEVLVKIANGQSIIDGNLSIQDLICKLPSFQGN